LAIAWEDCWCGKLTWKRAGGGVSAWAAKVSRIVLLDAPNRGVLRLPLYLRALHWFMRIFLFWVRLTYQDLMHGSAFVTNLRIQWIQHFRSKRADQSQQLPRIIQVLGTEDNVVYEYDSHDVLAFPDTSYIEVPGETHRDLAQLKTGAPPMAERSSPRKV
jgi:hypothetical protein